MKNLICIMAILAALPAPAQLDNDWIRPGKVWADDQGRPINAHGGGILYYQNTYYWFGEVKKGKTTRAPDVKSWEDYRVSAGGVSCYSSHDLTHWKYLGMALLPSTNDSLSDLDTSRVIERPKVIYNERTGQFVMWMHIDKYDYSFARAGVAVSNRPQGPYHYLGSLRPNGQMSRDMTLFQDDDGSAFLVYSSEDNRTMQVCLLSNDYLKPTATFSRILVDANREAPALFKFKSKYYLISSLCTGWDPNQALVASADSILGNWTIAGNPCTGPDADSTYHSQSTFVLPVEGKENDFIFMADRWNKIDLQHSTYVWLPMHFEKDLPIITWKNFWKPD